MMDRIPFDLENDTYHDSSVHHRGDSDFETHTESTLYKGRHYLDCVVVKNGKDVCRVRHVVNIR